MEVFAWIGSHWIDLAQTIGIVAAFLFAREALRHNSRIRQIANSIKLTEHHRILWERLLADPQLGRVLDENANTVKCPITAAEETIIIFFILHLSDTYYAMELEFWPRPEGLAKDVKNMLSLPIPRAVWERMKQFQDAAFVAYVERCLALSDDLSQTSA